MQSTLQVNNSRADLSRCSHRTRIHGYGGGGVNTGVDVGIRMPFALRLRQLTQIVSSSTPTGRMRDVAMED